MKIIRAKHAGFCFGVRRAYDLAIKANGKNVQTLGELIHNPEVLEELKTRGIKAISAISKLRDGSVIIRAHGISDKARKKLKQKALKIIDASCPFVKRIHDEVRIFQQKGIPCVIVGRRDHPEMTAVVEDFPEVLVVSKASDIKSKSLKGRKVAVMAQTTETAEKFKTIVEKLIDLGVQVVERETICLATSERQKAAIDLAKEVDLMIVAGGKKSNNTKQLYGLAKKIVASHWVESEKEIKATWFKNVKKVGITAGASTPKGVIERVEQKIQKISKNTKEKKNSK